MAEVENLALLDLDDAVMDAVEGLYHFERLLVSYYLHLGVELAHDAYRAGVVWLHVVDDKVVDALARWQDGDEALDVVRELVRLYRVDDGGLLVVDEIGVVGDAARKRPKSLEKVGLAVVASYPVYRIGDFYGVLHHSGSLQWFKYLPLLYSNGLNLRAVSARFAAFPRRGARFAFSLKKNELTCLKLSLKCCNL